MSARQLVVLGTASQVPTRHRNHNGHFLRWDGRGLLFDPGEGTQRQMIHAGVRAHGIHHICVTHFHGDHCLGLAGLIQRISLDAVPHEVTVHYPASGQAFFERLRHASIYHDRSQLRPCPIAQPGTLLTTPELSISALPLRHTTPCFGYRIEEPAGRRMLPEKLREHGIRGPLVGELLRTGHVDCGGRRVHLDEVSTARPGQSMALVMDTAVCDAAVELARGVDLLVIESTYLDSEAAEAADRGHLTARQAATIAAEAGAHTVVLTHFSQRHPDVAPFLAQASEVHPRVTAAQDGDVIDLPPRRRA